MNKKLTVAVLALALAGLAPRAAPAGPIAQGQAAAALESGDLAFDGGGGKAPAVSPDGGVAAGDSPGARGAFHADEAPSRGLRAMPPAPPSPHGRGVQAFGAEEGEKPSPLGDGIGFAGTVAGAVIGGVALAALGSSMGPLGAVLGLLVGALGGAVAGKVLGGVFGSLL